MLCVCPRGCARVCVCVCARVSTGSGGGGDRSRGRVCSHLLDCDFRRATAHLADGSVPSGDRLILSISTRLSRLPVSSVCFGYFIFKFFSFSL